MDKITVTKAAAKKRGRPRVHADAEAKALSDAQKKRAKREEQTTLRRDNWHNTFCITELPMVLPQLPPMMGHRAGHGQGGNAETAVPESHHSSTVQEIEDLLPPASPPIEATTDEPLPDWGDTALELDSPVRDTALPDAAHSGPSHPTEAMPNEHLDADYQTQDVLLLAVQMADQLMRFNGCCADCHEQAQSDHHGETVELAAYLDSAIGLCPDLLGTAHIASAGDALVRETNAAGRRRLFCGLDEGESPPRLQLRDEARGSREAGVTFDIDSITGFISSIAAAKQGVRWFPTQMAISDLQASLHLSPIDVYFSSSRGEAKRVRRPVHQVPHYTFGRLIGFEDLSLYFLFPHLYREEQQCSRLRDEDFRLWMDGVLLPALYKNYSSAHTQHYPSSYDHSRFNATPRGVELHAQRVEPVARQQQLSYYLQPERLSSIWEDITAAVQEPGLQQFRDIAILLQGKNLKVLTKGTTWMSMKLRFLQYWDGAVNDAYITKTLFFDVGKETCPTQGSRATSDAAMSSVDEPESNGPETAETLLYKRCCLESYAARIRHISTEEHSQKEVLYTFGMLQESGSLTIETGLKSPLRQAGLLYTQFYNSVKEIFAAGNVYPFTNSAIETLALDKKLRKTWELVGGGLSHQPAALVKAYLYTKLRCHFGLAASRRKSFGVREEYRVSKALFTAIDAEFQERNAGDMQILCGGATSTHYYSISTETMTRWLRWNINKFCVGFETVYSFQDPHFVTWEHTRMMLMFLRCLQFSSSGLIQTVSGCWQDVRLRPNPDQPNGIQRFEGLGFQHNMEIYGYAWFVDKIDWTTLTFKQPHASYMMFNNPSMQTAYRARYRQIRDVRVDFIRVDKARQWMQDFSAFPRCLELLEKYLRQLCLCAFRKDVFSHVKAILNPERREAALAGEVPLCYDSVCAALHERHCPPRLAHGRRLAVKSMDVLFAWLWEWKDGQFERKGWADKPYRMLFQQSFHAISSLRGKGNARLWRQGLKASFVRSHWLLPYPQKQGFMRKDKDTKEFVWWPSFHHGLNRYYQRLDRYGPVTQPLPTSSIKHHPSSGWVVAPGDLCSEHMPHVIQPEHSLLRLPEEVFYERLVELRDHSLANPHQSAPDAEPTLQEYNISDPQYRWDSRWSDSAGRYVWKTIDEAKYPNDCAPFLSEELDKYELLQHQCRDMRRRKQRNKDSEKDFLSESETADTDIELTSDEESLIHKRKQQAKAVRQVETRMKSLIEQDLKSRFPAPKSNEYLERRFRHRLDQVKDI